jgi:hypothetical protein
LALFWRIKVSPESTLLTLPSCGGGADIFEVDASEDSVLEMLLSVDAEVKSMREPCAEAAEYTEKCKSSAVV